MDAVIKQLVKYVTNLQREYIKRLTKESMKFMKTNPDDCILIKKYHRQLTDTAIKKFGIHTQEQLNSKKYGISKIMMVISNSLIQIMVMSP
jgi:hypothetical protein